MDLAKLYFYIKQLSFKGSLIFYSYYTLILQSTLFWAFLSLSFSIYIFQKFHLKKVSILINFFTTCSARLTILLHLIYSRRKKLKLYPSIEGSNIVNRFTTRYSSDREHRKDDHEAEEILNSLGHVEFLGHNYSFGGG